MWKNKEDFLQNLPSLQNLGIYLKIHILIGATKEMRSGLKICGKTKKMHHQNCDGRSDFKYKLKISGKTDSNAYKTKQYI